ncbi:MAG: hypothetical protein A2527_10625 [Candidatus Lambdaproteobacteria bacterium RIFOXYD2_FULL_50_16]|uniref:CinA-like protein n=1 Tax=Candidatus Lambdaproteobacteria bacterium RIFOXYD2_FULL_50_16 TaxID=1817772 RepID=A0A1F6GGR6_9PROT|nr:MAG: hypothetical protein A2527_10625 [Candidatus Lambdaproteobacteria bacterium RIFOXYD2_FULL_50_16]
MNPAVDKLKLAFLLTGEEVLSGEVTDTNGPLLARSFVELGIGPIAKRLVGDVLADLKRELKDLSELADWIVINGGLGSTDDDRTNQAVCETFGVELVEHPGALAHLSQRLQGPVLPGSLHYKQCLLPKGAEILHNPTGTAVGWDWKKGKTRIFATPGPPSELLGMLETALIPKLSQEKIQGGVPPIIRFLLMGKGESAAEVGLKEFLKTKRKQDLLTGLELGFRASSPYSEVKLWDTNGDHARVNELAGYMETYFAPHLISQGPELPQVVSELLKERGLNLGIAESCTGGLLASMITNLAGASEIFKAGVVSYSNEAKVEFLGVSPDTLLKQGAVSEATAKEMLEGILKRTGADCGISLTGIAGPSGAVEGKPVGTLFIGFGLAGKIQVRRLVIRGDRAQFQHTAALTGLDLLRRSLLGLDLQVPYYFDRLKPSI